MSAALLSLPVVRATQTIARQHRIGADAIWHGFNDRR
jgi:hypothetical protein